MRIGRFVAALFVGLVLCGCVSGNNTPLNTSVANTRGGVTRQIAFDTDEATWSALDVSPDGEHVLFDVLGDIYVCPVRGGDAVPITSGRAWDVYPQFSRDGKQIAFISDRGGVFELWTMDTDGKNLKRHDGTQMSTGIEDVMPVWLHDGKSLVLVRSDKMRQVLPVPPATPENKSHHGNDMVANIDTVVMSANGRIRRFNSIFRVTLQDTSVFVTSDARISRDGSLMAYLYQRQPFDLVRVLNVATGVTQTITDSSEALVSPGEQDVTSPIAFMPDGRSIIIGHRGRLKHIDIATGKVTRIPFRVHIARNVDAPLHHSPRKIANGGEVVSRVIRWPTLDHSWGRAIYSALGHLYATDIATGKARRLTVDSAFEYAPAISPDGKWVAYTSWTDDRMGHVMVVPIGGGVPKQVTSVPGRYANPAWSPDGSALVFIADTSIARLGLPSRTSLNGPFYLRMHQLSEAGTASSRELLEVYSLDVNTVRTLPIPSFSADGKRVFVASEVEVKNNQKQSGNFLLSVGVDDGSVVKHIRLTKADEVVVSPDGQKMAMVRWDSLYVMNVPSVAKASASADVPQFATDAATLLSSASPAHVAWHGAGALTWMVGTTIYRQEAGSVHLQNGPGPQRVVDIDVRHPRPMASGTYALVNARILTMRGQDIIERGTIVVTNNRIAAVGPSDSIIVPKVARVVDVSGTTIMPGLIDVHAHLHFYRNEIWPQQNTTYAGNLAYGITTAYDPSAPMLDAFGQAELVDAGLGVGPRIYSSGQVISGQPRYLDDRASYRNIRSLSDARAIVAHHARFGTMPFKEYSFERRDQRIWLIQAAREQGIPLTSHPDTYSGVLTRIVDGYGSVEHDFIRNAPVYADVLKFFAASGVHMTPTLVPISIYSKQQNMDDPKLHRFLPKANLDELERARKANSLGAPFVPVQISGIIRHGGLLSIGAHGNGPLGLCSHWEMWRFADLGMTPHNALRSATIVGAQKIDLDQELGSVETGKVADLLVLNANPLDDIKNSTKIRYVIKDGFIYDGGTLTRVWPTRAELKPWPWQTEVERERYRAKVSELN